MTTKEKIVDGIIRYGEKELLPKLSGMPKTEVATALVFLRRNEDVIYNKLADYIKEDEQGEVDENELLDMLRDVCKLTGDKITIEVPKMLIFPYFELAFDEDEIDRLGRYIKDGD